MFVLCRIIVRITLHSLSKLNKCLFSNSFRYVYFKYVNETETAWPYNSVLRLPGEKGILRGLGEGAVVDFSIDPHANRRGRGVEQRGQTVNPKWGLCRQAANHE